VHCEGEVAADAELNNPPRSAAFVAAPKTIGFNQRKLGASPWAAAADPGILENFHSV
jgi:hypothetical protein